MEARCMKCRKQVEIENAEEVTTKNNLNAIKGNCGTCNTKVCRIVGKAKTDNGVEENSSAPSP